MFIRKHEVESADLTLSIYQDPHGVLRSGNGATVWDGEYCSAASSYSVHYAELRAAALTLAAHVERTVKKGTRVLDIGAGTGIVGLVATALGADVTVSYHPLLLHCLSNACWVDCSCQIYRGAALCQGQQQ